MDLSFTLSPRAFFPAAPGDWAMLLAGAAARQAASPTAAAQARLERSEPVAGRFAPADGRFDVNTAAALARWKAG